MSEWRVARVVPGHEAEYAAETGGMTPFYRQTWPYRGRQMTALRAEYPGYVLIRANLDDPIEWHFYAKSKHWLGFLPGTVSQSEFDRLSAGLDEQGVRILIEAKSRQWFNKGDVLEIVSGHYAGHRVVCDYHRGERLRGYLQPSEQCLYMRAEQCVLAFDAEPPTNSGLEVTKRSQSQRQRQRFARKQSNA